MKPASLPQVAEDMYHFMHEFYDANPKLHGRALYVFGESYGGHYAPATANRIGKVSAREERGRGVISWFRRCPNRNPVLTVILY